MAHHIIYIPGLGDQRPHGQKFAIQIWRLYGFHVHYFPLGWHVAEGASNKLSRLLRKIDELSDKGHTVSIAGTSAGASAVLAVYARRPHICAVITIAGKINHIETIGEKIRRRYPDFIEMAADIPENIAAISRSDDLKNILCLYSEGDRRVLPVDAVIPGAKQKKVPGWNHVSAIFFGICFVSTSLRHAVRSRL